MLFLLAGDIYDKSIPSVEAVSMFNSFLTALSDVKASCLHYQR